MTYVFSAAMIFLPSVFEGGIQLACSWEVFLLNLHLSVSEYLENANRMAENQRNELRDEPLLFSMLLSTVPAFIPFPRFRPF